MPTFALTHEIFILDAYLQVLLDIEKKDAITKALMTGLLQLLSMKALGSLQIYPATDLRAPGWSFLMPITTSHISGHYFEKPGAHPHIRMDIYSCSGVNWERIIPLLHRHLSLGSWRATFLNRHIEAGEGRTLWEIAGEGEHIVSKRQIAVSAQ